MTDIGHTGIQVAPEVPTEDEMNKVRSILERAISSIVAMSQLSADVDMLRQTVASLQADTERLRTQNAGLDEALYQSRKARQEADARLVAVQAQASQNEYDRDRLARSNDTMQMQLGELQRKLNEAEQGRDDAELRAMELEDQVKAAWAKLNAIKEGYASIFEPEPKPAIGAVPNPNPVPIEMKPVIPADPEPLVQDYPAPTQEPVQAPLPDTSQEWRPGYSWDHTRQLYIKSTDAN